MARFTAYLMLPDGSLPSIGDTSYRLRPIVTDSVLKEYAAQDPILDYALTRGKSGAPGELSVVYPDEGYAILRDSWPKPSEFDSAVHLMFTAAGNDGLAHKHRDELSFVLYAHGQRLLIDPGVHSYNYRDPGRQYVVSTPAHNTVTVNGKSALPNKGIIENFLLDDAYSLVVASHSGFRPLEHRRTLLYVRPTTVIVIDEVGLPDPDTSPAESSVERYEFQQLWHLAPELEVVTDLSRSVATGRVVISAASATTISIAQLADGQGTGTILRGETEPLQGWVSASHGELTPAPVARFVAAGGEATFVTLISVSPDSTATATPAHEISAELLHLDAEEISIRWRDRTGWRRADVLRGETLSVSIERERSPTALVSPPL